MNDILRFISNDDITISELLRKIDSNSRGILFLTDKDNHLVASVTDGDVRRYLLSGGKMDGKAIEAANCSPKSAKTKDEAKSVMRKYKINAVPIVENGSIISIYFRDKVLGQQFAKLKVPVVINAGGKGTRLDPFTRVLPKPLIPIGDLPIIEHIMQQFKQYCCDEYHIIVNYKKQLIKAYFNESVNTYNLSYYDEETPLGTGGGLSLLKGKLNETFFFTNCDVLLRSDYEGMLKFHNENKNCITIICAYKNITIPYGVIEMGKNGSIIEMKEKPEVSFLTNTGMYIVEPEVLNDIEENVPIGFPGIIEKQRAKGKRVAVYPISESEWMDMGQMSGLEKMNRLFLGE